MTERTATDEALRRFAERTRDYVMSTANAKRPHLAADLVVPQIVADVEVLVKDGANAYLRRMESTRARAADAEQNARDILAERDEQ